MEKPTIKELAPYLPYGLKIKGIKPVATYDLMTLCDKKGLSNITIDTIIDTPNFYKPILRPLSDLTKEIEVNGERFVPMEILVKIEDLFFKEIVEIKSNKAGNIFWADYYTEDDDKKRFCYCINSFQIGHLEPNKHSFIRAGYELYEKLFEWQFDVFGLIEKGLAIDINTLNQKP